MTTTKWKKFLRRFSVRAARAIDPDAYSHWDVLATARIIDPEAWRSLDERNAAGANIYYVGDAACSRAVKAAVNMIRAGYRPTERMLMNNADLQAWLVRPQ